MCGITGFIDLKQRSAEENNKILRKMCDVISHRGPDSEGQWCNSEDAIYLGHRRLSIIDLSPEGHQPMASLSGRYVICFNGEIYNYLELKSELENKGHKFRGHSDTEVLVALFSLYGIKQTITKIRGMFAIALWDKKEKSLTLIRDHIGKKPLYFGICDGRIFFGSELKTLHALNKSKPQINRSSFNQYIQFGYISAPHCIYKGACKLKPGHYISLSASSMENDSIPSEQVFIEKMQPFWQVDSFAIEKHNIQTDHASLQQDLKKRLSKAVKQRMISDVPLGAFLSGGIDSSLIVALMQEHSPKPIRTFTIGFEEDRFNEAPYAEEVAKHLGTNHSTHMITSEETRSIIPSLGLVYDEPFSDVSQIPTYHVCKMAKQHSTVALSGDGGDELFCGYSRYFTGEQLFRKVHSTPLFIRKALSSILQSCPTALLDKTTSVLSKYISTIRDHDISGKRLHSIARCLPSETVDDLIRRVLSNELNPTNLSGYNLNQTDIFTEKGKWADLKDPLDRMMLFDMMMYLPDDILVKTDRASMAVSLEVRSPLLDVDLIEWAWSISAQDKIFSTGHRGKKPLYDLLTDYIPQNLIDRPKQGFSVPLAVWLRGPLNEWANDFLSLRSLKETGLYNAQNVHDLWMNFEKGRTNDPNTIWSILMAQTWYQQWHQS